MLFAFLSKDKDKDDDVNLDDSVSNIKKYLKRKIRTTSSTYHKAQANKAALLQ